jgi:hypothetical protein
MAEHADHDTGWFGMLELTMRSARCTLALGFAESAGEDATLHGLTREGTDGSLPTALGWDVGADSGSDRCNLPLGFAKSADIVATLHGDDTGCGSWFS